MRIAVVTPTYHTPAAWLAQCLRSVAEQSVSCTHFVVSAGDESPPAVGSSITRMESSRSSGTVTGNHAAVGADLYNLGSWSADGSSQIGKVGP